MKNHDKEFDSGVQGNQNVDQDFLVSENVEQNFRNTMVLNGLLEKSKPLDQELIENNKEIFFANILIDKMNELKIFDLMSGVARQLSVTKTNIEQQINPSDVTTSQYNALTKDQQNDIYNKSSWIDKTLFQIADNKFVKSVNQKLNNNSNVSNLQEYFEQKKSIDDVKKQEQELLEQISLFENYARCSAQEVIQSKSENHLYYNMDEKQDVNQKAVDPILEFLVPFFNFDREKISKVVNSLIDGFGEVQPQVLKYDSKESQELSKLIYVLKKLQKLFGESALENQLKSDLEAYSNFQTNGQKNADKAAQIKHIALDMITNSIIISQQGGVFEKNLYQAVSELYPNNANIKSINEVLQSAQDKFLPYQFIKGEDQKYELAIAVITKEINNHKNEIHCKQQKLDKLKQQEKAKKNKITELESAESKLQNSVSEFETQLTQLNEQYYSTDWGFCYGSGKQVIGDIWNRGNSKAGSASVVGIVLLIVSSLPFAGYLALIGAGFLFAGVASSLYQFRSEQILLSNTIKDITWQKEAKKKNVIKKSKNLSKNGKILNKQNPK